MTVSNAIGCPDSTPLKWERLGMFLGEIHIRATKSILDRERWAPRKYIYIDLHAGPGVYRAEHGRGLDGKSGSPLIAMHAARAAGIPFHGYLVEPVHHRDLADSVRAAGFEADCTVIREPCESAIDRLIRDIDHRSYGFAFIDPTGYPSWETLRHLADSFHRIDIMINVNTTIHKRCLKIATNPETMRPSEHLRALGKERMILWRPAEWDKWQFCLAYLTNGPVFGTRRQRFHPADTPDGKAMIRLIDHTNEERRAISLPGILPGFEETI